MSHDFTTDKKLWMQSFDKNTGEYTMLCTALPDDVATFRTFVTNAMDDNGQYLGVPTLAALRKAMHAHYAPHIIKYKSGVKEPAKPAVAEPLPSDVVAEVPDGRRKKKFS